MATLYFTLVNQPIQRNCIPCFIGGIWISEGIDASHSGGHPPQSTREESSILGAVVGEFVPSQVPMIDHASRQYYHVVREKGGRIDVSITRIRRPKETHMGHKKILHASGSSSVPGT